MDRRAQAGLAGVALAGLGAWAGQRLGGDSATAGLGAGIGAVSGAFAPSVAGWLSARLTARQELAWTAELAGAVERPSRLLDPRRGVVEFVGRTDELASLIAWCEQDTASRMRLLTGPGGVGKTRLALQLADAARELGWWCEWVGADQEAAVVSRISAAKSGRVLLMVDYAETRTGLSSLLRAAAQFEGPGLRVLLLARSAGQWWDQLGSGEPAVRELVNAAGRDGVPVAPAVSPLLTDDEIVRHAIPRFADALAANPPRQVEIVLRPGRARILELHAAALVAVLDSIGQPTDRVVRVRLADVLDELLWHEARFWLGSAQAQGILDGPSGLTTSMVRQAVAATCLIGAIDEDEALQLLDRVPGADRSEKIVTWLRELYPPELAAGEWLGTLQPDRLAERHVLAELADSPEFARRCLEGLSQRQARRAVILLARASTESELAEQLLARLLPLVSKVIVGLDAAPETLTSIANAIPYPSATLGYAHASIMRRLIDALPRTAHPAERSAQLLALGMLLTQIGYRDEALGATEEALTLLRKLARDEPQSYQADLAHAMSNHCAQLSHLDRWPEARLAGEEAISLLRELAATDHGRHDPDLATGLSNLGVVFSALGLPVEALKVTEESTAIRRAFAGNGAQAARRAYAISLSNLGVRFGELGRYDKAVTAARESVSVLRDLARADHDRYISDLASSLESLGVRLAELGHYGEALAVHREAVEIQRELAAASPGRHRADLGRELMNLSYVYSRLDRHAEALKIIEESVAVAREEDLANPVRHRADLAHALTNLAVEYTAADRLTEALQVTEEAVALYRELAATNPRRYLPDLARSLANLSVDRSKLGHSAEALPPELEALSIYRQLAVAIPERFGPDLARSLANVAVSLSALGRKDEALERSEEAVAQYRKLATTNPALHGPELARALTNLGSQLSDLGRHAEARQATDEAVTIRRTLAASHPQRHGAGP
jgi:tetratricopeptide (TPR) repeat protein